MKMARLNKLLTVCIDKVAVMHKVQLINHLHVKNCQMKG